MRRFLIVVERAGADFSAYSPDSPGRREFLSNSWRILGTGDGYSDHASRSNAGPCAGKAFRAPAARIFCQLSAAIAAACPV